MGCCCSGRSLGVSGPRGSLVTPHERRRSRVVAVRASGSRVVFDTPPLIPIGEAFELSDDDHAHSEFSEGVLIGN